MTSRGEFAFSHGATWDELDEVEERLLLIGIRYEVQQDQPLRCEVLA